MVGRADTSLIHDGLILLLAVVTSPVWLLGLVINRHWRKHLGERLGVTGPADIWVHAASMGEVAGLETFLSLWHSHHPEDRILITCNTVTGRAHALKKYPFARVSLAPLDWGPLVCRFVSQVSPRVHVLSELDIWPARQRCLGARNIPTCVVGARLSERGFRRTRRFWPLLKQAYQSVTLWGVREEAVAQRLMSLGVDAAKISQTGPLKYDALLEKQKTIDWGRRLNGLPVVVLGSVHPSEELPFVPLASKTQLVVVPRHPQKVTSFVQALEAEGVTVVLWSSGQAPQKGEVLLVDEMGLLAGLYEKATCAFVGGTLLPVGGHNVLEPACYAVPVVVGPHTEHVADEMAVLLEHQGIRQTTDVLPVIEKWLQSPSEAREVGKAANQSLKKLTGGSKKTLELLEKLSLSR